MSDSHEISAVYELSPMQQGMLFHSVLAPQSGAYVEQLVCTMRRLRPEALEEAWRRVVARHTALRTAFAWKSAARMLQGVHRSLDICIARHDWTSLDAGEQASRLREFLSNDRARGFDLSRAPLMRLALFQTAPDRHEFVWTYHHALVDGWSVALVLNELLVCYEAICAGAEPQLSAARPYQDYIDWLRTRSRAGDEAFWRSRLRGIDSPTDLLPAAAVSSESANDARTLRLSATATRTLEEFARRNGLTLSGVVQGAWAVLLSRYSGNEDVIFGATVSGRPADLAGAGQIVGLFINTVPVRARVRSEMDVVSWLRAQQMEQAEATEHQHCALVDIQGWSEIQRPQPLFTNLFVFENYPVHSSLKAMHGGLAVEDVRSIERTNYPLTAVAGVENGCLAVTFSYDTARFDGRTIERMLGRLGCLLEGIAGKPGARIGELPMMSEAERNRVLLDWNATDVPVPSECFPRLFEKQAEAHPDAVAAAFEDRSLTYRELDAEANSLACCLQTLGVGPEAVVGVCLERSERIAVALVGIMKAGGAYLPLDPAYPRERLRFMIEDAKPKVVIAEASLVSALEPLGVPLFAIDREWPATEGAAPRDPGLTPEHLAYVIYTSGSTGRPKGVMLRHAGLTSLCTAEASAYGIGPGLAVLQYASLSFDAAVPEIFLPLAQGATVHFASREDLLDTARLHRLMRERRIGHAVFPPSVLKLLDARDLPDLNTIIAAAERCPQEVAAQWGAGWRFLNAYGPTENTVCSSMWECAGEPDPAPPIGRPVANVRIYILDRDHEPVPAGVTGEIYIGGACLARGYIGRPELTAARFVPDPFAPSPGGRLYRTGDAARYREDGNIEFIGRKDEQVKIRGFRIEPGEVEAAMEAHPDVMEAAVAARGDALAAYYVGPAAVAELRAWLEARLPSHMVPSVFVRLEAMPRLPNGKLNRRALPDPEARSGAVEYSAPRTPVEELLAGIWAQVLGVAQAGREDSFFDLGGHSLLVTQAISRVRQAFGREIPLQALFDHPRVSDFAAAIEAAESAGGEPMDPLPDDAPAPLSFAQERLWFLAQLEPGNPFYNNPLVLRLTGELDPEVLERTLNEVVRRHEVLRTAFREVDGKPKAVVAPDVRIAVPLTDLRALPESAGEEAAAAGAREEISRPFDLAAAPLMRARLWRLAGREHILLVVLHHIACDGWSTGLFMSEVAAIYPALREGRSSPLPALGRQYRDYAAWQRKRLSGELLENQLAYWKKQLEGCPPVLELPGDRPRPPIQSYRGAHRRMAFPADLLERLRRLGRRENATLFMTLLAAFQVLLARYTRQHDIAVGTAIANRTRAEAEPLIGFFVNTLVLRTDLSGNPTFRELLARVRATALGAYAHQDLPFETLVEALNPERNLSHSPLFQVMLTLNNAPLRAADLPGLKAEPLEAENGASRFDLTLELTETTGGLAGSIEYSTDLFDASTVTRMTEHFERLLRAVAEHPEYRLSELSMLGEEERRDLITGWNATAAEYPSESLIHELFEAQAAERPHAIAVRSRAASLTYRDLDRRANQLARYLRARGAGPETIVGLMLERTPEMLVAVLGVLKAGAAYLPLDPEYPPERLGFMLRDSHAPVLITHSGTEAVLAPRFPGRTIALDRDREEIEREDSAALRRTGTPDNLAYVIYTSGSTGQPKGAMLRHRGLCNLVREQARAFRIGPESRVLQFAPLSFDASVWETFMALANGATLWLAPEERADIEALHRVLREERITTVTLPPSVLAALAAHDLPALETVIAAGEACSRQLVAKWAPGRRFFNAYGPTETTVCASMALASEAAEGDPPIGRPLANMQLYVLDQDLQPAPVGVPGELFAGGVGVARGYLGRSDKTAESFVPDPFGPAGSRLYRTGDLVRRLADGQLQFLGRIDSQTKVRGYRVEPAEIEAALAAIAGIKEAAVVVRAGQLVAYLSGPGVPDRSELRARLKNVLPDYMIPARFVTLPALPLSPSGKIDRRALAKRPDDEGARREAMPPRTDTERTLARIWTELLGRDTIGVEDNFFELGGHSLLATQVSARIRREFEAELPLRVLFEHPVLEDLAREVDSAAAAGGAAIAAVLDAVAQLTDDEVQTALVANARKAAGA